MEQLPEEYEIFEANEAHREALKRVREAAVNLGVAFERERIRKAAEGLIPPAGTVIVNPEADSGYRVALQAVLDLINSSEKE